MENLKSIEVVIQKMKVLSNGSFCGNEFKNNEFHKLCSKSYSCHDFLNKSVLSIMESRLEQVKQTPDLSFVKVNEILKVCDCHEDSKFDPLLCLKDLCYRFIVTCLNTLVNLHDIIKSDDMYKNETDILGINDQKVIKDICNLVIAFGILPNLLDGVGLPVKSNHRLYISKHPRKLFLVLKIFIFILQNEFLMGILLPILRSDLLASLIQLSYKPSKNKFLNCPCLTNRVICQCCSDICEHEKVWCQQKLFYFLNCSPLPLIVRELLVLQRSETGGKRPKYEWYKNAIGDLISQCLMRKNGVNAVLTAILQNCDQDKLTPVQINTLGKVLAKVPRQIETKEAYYSIIIPQVLDLITTTPSKEVSHFIMVAINCIENILENHYDIGATNIQVQALFSLNSLYTSDFVEIDENELSKELQLIYNVCASQSVENFIILITRNIHACFVLYCMIDHPIIKKTLKKTLVSILLKNSIKDCTDFLGFFILPKSSPSTPQVLPCVKIKYKGKNDCFENQSITVIGDHNNFFEELLSYAEITLDKKIKSLISLLQISSLEEIRCEFFIVLLIRLTTLIKNEPEMKKNKSVQIDEKSVLSGCSMELLHIDNQIEDIQENIVVFSLIAALMDTFGHSVLKNTPQIVSFVRCILSWSWYTEENSFIILHKENEAIDLCLLLLSTLLGTGKLTSADFEVMHELLPALKNISLKHGNQSTRNMANDLHVFIATYGAVTLQTSSNISNQTDKKTDFSSDAAYHDAMKDLLDPLLPTRGHALFQLSKLLQKRNKLAVKNYDKLLDIFEANLSHEDTYLYLASLEGLLALVDLNHKQVLPVLCQKFAQIQGKNEILSSELRMKLCEAIVKSCHLCGSLLPSYTQFVIPALLIGVKDSDPFVRTSSLSALGDVSGLLQFSVDPYLVEIISAVYHVVSTDKSCEVRRAGIQVFSLMFKGMGTRLLQIVSAEIKEVYRFLNLVARTDEDELTRVHAGNALNILDDIMKELLSKKPSFQKKIQVLPDI
ncbi:transport and Golgi organization protein 6 homolog isoform X1 [Hydra vulgaris]|uniref:transport and Golgi organization protein 6 homolog isoform X1 n=1 Tax=Hydra vulgaris TaxID=6087 RepID=UPI0032E9DCEF